MKMLYSSADEKFVKSIIVYADGDKVLYQDSAGSVAVVAEDVIDAFKKNMLLIADGNEIFKPISVDTENETFNAVTTTTVETVTTTTVVTYYCEASE